MHSLSLWLGYNPDAFVKTVGLLFLAFLFGGLIGLERQMRQRNAGLRTMVLVVVGATAFVHLGFRLMNLDGELKILPNIVSGIGFLGAGVIMKEGEHVKGLNTAATLWASAAVGAFLGCGLVVEAAALTLFVLASNTLLRPIVNYLNRMPLHSSTEATYAIHLICKVDDSNTSRNLLTAALTDAKYPVRTTRVTAKGAETLEIEAILSANSAHAVDLDQVCNILGSHPEIVSVTWSANTNC